MPDSPQASGAARPAEPVSDAPEAIAPAPEPKLPSRKDASLKEFLGKMDDYAPIVCFAFFLYASPVIHHSGSQSHFYLETPFIFLSTLLYHFPCLSLLYQASW